LALEAEIIAEYKFEVTEINEPKKELFLQEQRVAWARIKMNAYKLQ